MSPKREGRWDCPACGSKGILGRYKHCTSCNAARGDVKFYLPTDEPVIVDSKLLELANAGPDWICGICGSSNRGDASTCVDCGAQKGASKSLQKHIYNRTNPQSSVPDKVQNEVGSLARPKPEHYSGDHMYTPIQDYTSSSQQYRSESAGSVNIKYIGVAVIIAAVIGLVFFFTRSHKVPVNVSMSWNRTIYVSGYQTVSESDWAVPQGGRLVSTGSAIHHYDHVYDHTDHIQRSRQVSDGSETYACGSHQVDEGNGFFGEETDYCTRELSHTEYYIEDVDVYRDDPVYEPWYTYNIERWIPVRTVYTSGQNESDPAPAWGELVLVNACQPVIGSECEASRAEHYIVYFKDVEGHEYPSKELSFDDWSKYDESQTYTLEVNNLGTVLNDPLNG